MLSEPSEWLGGRLDRRRFYFTVLEAEQSVDTELRKGILAPPSRPMDFRAAILISLSYK